MIGRPHHFGVYNWHSCEVITMSACGLTSPDYHTAYKSKVNCIRCMKTNKYKTSLHYRVDNYNVVEADGYFKKGDFDIKLKAYEYLNKLIGE